MDTQACQILITVAQKHSFSLAAEELYLSQSVVSKIIKKIEAEFDTQIFERNAHHVVLTEKGKIILETAYQIVSLIDQTKLKTSDDQKPDEPSSLWFPRSIDYMMPERISILRKRLPHLTLDLSNCTKLERADSDLIIVPEALTHSSLYLSYDKRFLAKDQLCFVYSGDELQADFIPSLSILARKRLVLLRKHPQLSLSETILEKLADNQIEFDDVLFVETLAGVFNKISTMPDSCSFLPYSAKGGAFRGIHFLPVNTLNINVDLVCMIKNGINPKTAEKIIRIIKKGFVSPDESIDGQSSLPLSDQSAI